MPPAERDFWQARLAERGMNAPAIIPAHVWEDSDGDGLKDIESWDFENGTVYPGGYYAGNVLNCQQNSWQGPVDGGRNTYIGKDLDCSDDSKRRATGRLQACVADPNEFEWFRRGGRQCSWQTNAFPWDQPRPVTGPNQNCPTAMLGLSGDRMQVMEKLDHMYPVPGGTFADVGLMWGLRSLSPNNQWDSFWGYQGRFKPGRFKHVETRKMMILLTDGTNMPSFHFESYYGCNETGTRGIAGDCWKAPDIANLSKAALDNLMLDSCRAIREDYGVELYTIAVDIADRNAVRLLRDCAGSDDYAFDVSSADLEETFEAIAKRTIRLTK